MSRPAWHSITTPLSRAYTGAPCKATVPWGAATPCEAGAQFCACAECCAKARMDSGESVTIMGARASGARVTRDAGMQLASATQPTRAIHFNRVDV